MRRGHRDARKGLRVSGRIRIPPFSLFIRNSMDAKTLSIFVDESGNFSLPDTESRFYIIGMVFHDQSIDISAEIAQLERSDSEVGLEGHCFYRLFQLADLICTLHLVELKLSVGTPLSRSEQQFFGGPRMFRHNILRYIKSKEI